MIRKATSEEIVKMSEYEDFDIQFWLEIEESGYDSELEGFFIILNEDVIVGMFTVAGADGVIDHTLLDNTKENLLLSNLRILPKNTNKGYASKSIKEYLKLVSTEIMYAEPICGDIADKIFVRAGFVKISDHLVKFEISR